MFVSFHLLLKLAVIGLFQRPIIVQSQEPSRNCSDRFFAWTLISNRYIEKLMNDRAKQQTSL